MDIITEITEWMINFLEKPHPGLNNLPVCPFVKQARIKGQIQFEVREFNNLEGIIRDFASQDHFEVLWIINPDKSCSAKMAYDAENDLQPLLTELGLLAFGGGPDDDFMFKGIKTRQEPYCNLVIQSRKVLMAARAILQDTAYYD